MLPPNPALIVTEGAKIAPSVLQGTPAAWGGKGPDVREIVAPGLSGSVVAGEVGLRLSTRNTQSRHDPRTSLAEFKNASVSSDRSAQVLGPLSVFPAGWLTCEPLATSVRPPRSPMRSAQVVRQYGDQLRSPPIGVNQLACPSWSAPPLTLSPRQGSVPIPRE